MFSARKTLYSLLFLVISSITASAQSSPNFVDRRVLCANTSACNAIQNGNTIGLNQIFQLKQDYPITPSAVPGVGGVTFSGTPSIGQVPVATGPTTATWQSISGGSGSSITYTLQNTGGSTMKAGAAVYITGSGTISLAEANAYSTAGVVSLVSASILNGASGVTTLSGILSLTTSQWDAIVTGESGGLTSGSLYFLDPSTAGNLTKTAPSTTGQVITVIGRAISPTVLSISLGTPTLL